MSVEPTLTELLRAAGYGHERTKNADSTRRHRVYRLSDNETVGEFDAFEAADWLRGQSRL
jgi:hypothetical protein